MSSEYLVEVKDLKQYFPIRTGFMKTTLLKAVDGVNFGIKPGETLGAAARQLSAVRFFVSTSPPAARSTTTEI